MFSIDYSPQAHRALGAMSSASRRSISQLLKAVAEMAELFPGQATVWRRLGKVTDRKLEIDIEQHAVCVELIPDGGRVRVLKIADGKGSLRRARTATAARVSSPRRKAASRATFSSASL